MTLSMAIPVDSDGFLRRECPTSEQEFKWLPASEDEERAGGVPDGGHFCPYWGVKAQLMHGYRGADCAYLCDLARGWEWLIQRYAARRRCSGSATTARSRRP